jgi:FkbM family methyltransferase
MKSEEIGYIQEDNGQWRFKLRVPDFLARWDVYAVWEKERTLNMEKNLKPGMVLFDIGAEKGWQSAVYAQFVGGENMVLIEPTAEYWPNLKFIWEENKLGMPKMCFAGLISPKSLGAQPVLNKWPAESDGPLFDGLKYVYLHDNPGNQQASIDDLALLAKPDALTMDCEGVEIRILEGAIETLRNHRPLVWASLHPDMALANYGSNISEVHNLMASVGYTGKLLGTDHEEHWFFWPEERQVEL